MNSQYKLRFPIISKSLYLIILFGATLVLELIANIVLNIYFTDIELLQLGYYHVVWFPAVFAAQRMLAQFINLLISCFPFKTLEL